MAAPVNGGSSGLQVSGRVDPGGLSTTVTIEYGPSAALGSSQSAGIFTGNGVQTFSTTLYPGGLALGTTFYRIVTTNANGTTTSATLSFTHSSGTPDFSFSGDGIQITPFLDGATLRPAQGQGVGVQADGKVVVAGFVHNGSNNDMALARYLPDGTLDTAFGNGGWVISPTGNGEDVFTCMLIQPDGKIIAAGSAWDGTRKTFAIRRYTTTGAPDASFGTDELVRETFGSGSSTVQVLALQPDGLLIACGTNDTGPASDIAIGRYLVNGSRDLTFDGPLGNGNGNFLLSLGTFDYGYGCAIQSDGKIVLAAQTQQATRDFGVVRLNPNNGMLDTSFDADGIVITQVSAGNDIPSAVRVQRDGRLLVSGWALNGSTDDFAVVRYNTNGSLDSTFGTAGKAIVPVGSGKDWSMGSALQPDGKLVVVGYVEAGATDVMGVLRFNPDGSLDTAFGSGGKVTLNPGPLWDRLNAVALTPDGNIVAAGYSDTAENVAQFAVVRLLGGPNDLLVNGGFESQETFGGGVAPTFGDWTEDQGSSVTAENGITPYEGTRMLKFLSTGHTGPGAATTSDISQYVDLSPWAADIALGRVYVRASARFNRVAGNANTDTQFRLNLLPRTGAPSTNPGTNALPGIDSQLISDSDLATWQLLSGTLLVPAGTTNLYVNCYAVENVQNNTTAPEFDGHYMDGMRLEVIVNVAPVANAGGPYLVGNNQNLVLNGSASADANAVQGDFIGTYEWDIDNNGTYDVTGAMPTVTWAQLGTFGRAAEGSYTVGLRVTDSFGATSTTTAMLTVDPVAPTLVLPANIVDEPTNPAGRVVTFSVTAMDNVDPAPQVTVIPPSGSNFSQGLTTVNVTATDAAGNSVAGSFTVRILSTTDDLDDDGLNDVAEFRLVSLGFDWQVGQPALVSEFLTKNALFTQGNVDATAGTSRLLGQADVTGNPGAFSLYSLTGLQELYVDTPVIVRNEVTGKWRLTLSVQKATTLPDFLPFPFTPEGTMINGEGKIEFEFTVPDSKAFFRVHAR